MSKPNLKQNSRIPSTIDYAFLKAARTKSHFFVQQAFSRELVQKHFGNHEIKSPQELDQLLEQNEYQLVIDALKNILNEKTYLKSRTHELVAVEATEEDVVQEREKIRYLNNTLELMLEQHKALKQQVEEQDFVFIKSLSHKFQTEVEHAPEPKKHDLLYLGRWQYMIDWMTEREDSSLQEQFKKIMPQDPEFISKTLDSPEIKKIKQRIQDQRRQELQYKKDLQALKKKKDYYTSQLQELQQKITDMNDVLKHAFESGEISSI
ncbi:hypothetical protein EDD86DRAFT_248054 [Gorgonomyces haynaldii]|nr:hypothetical protein EDD86DRAFT_248054 [Gorgonomyces haynaldii]